VIARLLISPNIERRLEAIKKILASHIGSLPAYPSGRRAGKAGGNTNHPDVLYFETGEKLGIAEARKIKEHFSLKPYSASGRVVIIEDAGVLTPEAQNALLKTLEEPPKEAILILGAGSDAELLPTILSRCQIRHLEATSYDTPEYHREHIKNLEGLLNASIEERFAFIEKLKDREQFLHSAVNFFRQQLLESTHERSYPLGPTRQFLQELLQAEEWAKQNVNTRAILEYLMLVMPSEI